MNTEEKRAGQFLDPTVVRREALDSDDLVAQLTLAPALTVVMPVFNGGPVVRDCIEAMLAHTGPSTRVVAIDDASTDERTSQMLDMFARESRLEVIRHRENVGFTRTANHAIALAGRDDVILVNSDALVGPMWDARMRWVAASAPEIATVSAASNDAASMSFPAAHTSNAWFPRQPWAETARLVARALPIWTVDVPAAHGFCMYIKRSAIDSIGVLDEQAFPVGYGEEVDFSQRAIASGLRNVLAPHVFARHYRSQSFGSEKRGELVRSSRAVLGERYPTMRRDVRDWESSVADLALREQMRQIQRRRRTAGSSGGRRTLSVDGSLLTVMEEDPLHGPVIIQRVPFHPSLVVPTIICEGIDLVATVPVECIPQVRVMGVPFLQDARNTVAA
jgi:GT2 family glycosyltransferase